MVEPRGGGGGWEAATARTSMVRSPAGQNRGVSGEVGRREEGVGGGGGWVGGRGGRLTEVAKVLDRLVQHGVHGCVLVDWPRQQLQGRK